MRPLRITSWDDLAGRQPVGAMVEGVDVVVVRYDDDDVSVLYGRCLHRGALMADGTMSGDNLLCGLHGWDYSFRTGVSSYDNRERIHRFVAWIDVGAVTVDADEISAWALEHPQPYDRSGYLGDYADPHGTPEEPHVAAIQALARDGLRTVGHHGPVTAMGCQGPATKLGRHPGRHRAARPAAAARQRRCRHPNRHRPSRPAPVGARQPDLRVRHELRCAFRGGQDGTRHWRRRSRHGDLLGRGRHAPDEQQACSRYLYELASGRFGWDLARVADVQGFHFKFGQGAKTGTGGHLPGIKVKGRIAAARGLEPGTPAVSPATFTDLRTTSDFRQLADAVRDTSGGIPIGAKLSAQHIEADLDAALVIGVDYVILDGRGGGTGAAPLLFRDNISVPTIPALARARRHLDSTAPDVTLVITGGLRTPADFAKAIALGADAVAVSNAAMQAIGCVGMRACHTDNCPVGIATQQPHLRARLDITQSAAQLTRFLQSAVELMTVLARACGHSRLGDLSIEDLTTFDRDIHHLAGVPYGGLQP